MSPKLGHLMGLSCSMLALHGFWFGTPAWCQSATFQKKVKQGRCVSDDSFFNFAAMFVHPVARKLLENF